MLAVGMIYAILQTVSSTYSVIDPDAILYYTFQKDPALTSEKSRLHRKVHARYFYF